MKQILSCSIIFAAVGVLTCASVNAGPEMSNANPSGVGNVEAEKSGPPDEKSYVGARSPEDLSPKRKPAKDENTLMFDPNNVDWEKDNQQALGNYMQMKSEGNCFYGAFTGNGAAFGRPFANNDPIFFKTCVKPDFETKS